MKKVIYLLLSIIVVLIIFLQFYLLKGTPIPDKYDFSFDLEKVRTLAEGQQGSKPTQLNSLLIARGQIPKCLVVANQGFKTHHLYIYTYQIVYPDKTIIIDAALDKELQLEKMSNATFYPGNYDSMQSGFMNAVLIIFTHEHLDHCAGIAKSAKLTEIADKVTFTAEQLHSPLMEAAGFSPEIKGLFTPLTYDKFHPLAPGVVLIKAPGHTPGTQMLYVCLERGVEFLLVGDVAWHMDNISIPQAHPRLINWILKEDADVLVEQLKFLHDLHNEHPEINIVVSHDGNQMENYIKERMISKGFR